MKSILIVVTDDPDSEPRRSVSDVARARADVDQFAELVVAAAQDVVACCQGLTLPELNGVPAAGTDAAGRTTIEVPVDLPANSLDALRLGHSANEPFEAAVYNRLAEMTGEDAMYLVDIRVI